MSEGDGNPYRAPKAEAGSKPQRELSASRRRFQTTLKIVLVLMAISCPILGAFTLAFKGVSIRIVAITSACSVFMLVWLIRNWKAV